MDEGNVESINVSERVNGWWVSVRFESGHEEHHGPYLDQESAETEAERLSAEKLRSADGERRGTQE
jgi:hypothetical protein